MLFKGLILMIICQIETVV